ncbi:unnamed protein product, partial [Owenia fusiformis]
MATAKQKIDPLIDSVKCAICMEILDDPRSLPCMHSYCRKCIQSTMDKYQDKEFPCPICRDSCPIPDEGAAGLKVNCFASSVLDAVKDLSLSSSSSRVIMNCDICLQEDENVPAILKCIECNEKLCKGCGRTHKLLHSTKSHNVFQINGDTIQDTRAAMDMLSKRTLYCQVHTKEPLKYFCTKDQCLICQDCFALEHQGHPLNDIEQTAKANLKNLRSVIDIGKQRSAKYEDRIQRTHVQKNDFEKNIEECRSKLDADQKAVETKIKAHFKALNEKLTTMGNAAFKSKIGYLADLQFDKDAIDGTVKQLEALQEHGHAADIVYMIPEMNNKIKTWSSTPDFDPYPEAMIYVKPSQINDE